MERSPGVIAVKGGFVLNPSVVSHWANVESIMQTTIDKLRYNSSTSRHQPPPYPSSFGYRLTFSKRKAAKDAIKPSLLAFHHLLAYCSYIIASTSAPHFSRDGHRSLYENPTGISSVFEKIVPSDVQDNSHILLKLLWSTLGEIRQTRNFSGVVVTYDSPYDCQSIQDMHLYGVPVFIRWSDRFRLQTYSGFPNGSVLTQWRPPLTSFLVLDQPQHSSNPNPATPIQQLPPPPPVAPLDKCADRYPWEYVETRKAKISSVANKPLSWLAREKSAELFRKPGRSGALVYQFNLVGAVEEGTGKHIQKWERSVLTRAEAQLLWSGIDPRNLWYVAFFFFFFRPFSKPRFRYDCEHDQWNYCQEFNFTENTSHQFDSDDDDGDYMGEPLPSQPKQNDIASPRQDDDDDDHMGEPLPSQSKQNDAVSLHQDDDCMGEPLPSQSEQNDAVSLHHDNDDDHMGEPLPSQPKQNDIASPRQDDNDDHMGEPLPSQSEQNDAVSLHHDNDDDHMGEPLPSQPEQNDAASLHQEFPGSHHDTANQTIHSSLPSRSDTGSCNVDDRMPHPEASSDAAQGSVVINESVAAPSFDSHAHLGQLLRAQNDTPSGLVSIWNDVGDFFHGRYGVTFIHHKPAADRQRAWSTRVGITGAPPHNIVELHDHINGGHWPPGICDLSPDLIGSGPFSVRPPDTPLHISHVSDPEGYLVEATHGRNAWKLLIQDPLTILQIVREGWESDPSTLIVNLIKKGIPFQILNPVKLEGSQFYGHSGPVVHPAGREPQHVDYLAYRQELAEFFAHYPHAYAASLSAGGILWRVAMDVLPMPHESDITRPFHPNGCISRTVGGEKYWIPKLTQLEEDVIVGVYKWAICKFICPQKLLRDTLPVVYSFPTQSQRR